MKQLSQSEELNHTKLVERGEPLFLNKSEAMTRTPSLYASTTKEVT